MLRWSHDAKFALRMAGKNPWMTAASVVVLGAGMAITIASFSLLWDAYFVTLPFEDGDRIVAVYDVRVPDPDDTPPRLAVLREWDESQTSLAVLAASYTRWRDVHDGEGGLTRYPVATITASGFEVTRVPPLLGRVLTGADEQPGAPPVAVVSHRVWRSLLGADPDAIGRVLEIDGAEREVVGVMPEGYRFPVSEDIWVPFHTDPEAYGGIEPRWMRVFGRLADGTTIERATAELEAIRTGYASALPGDADLTDRRTVVVPYVQGENEPGANALFFGMFVFVVMVLVVACASVANLLLARATSRTGEIAVRAALGASRRRLVAQLFIEALLLSCAGALFGVTDAWIGLQWFETFLEVERTPFWVQFGLSPAAVAFAIVAALGAAAISGIVPAIKATGVAMHDVLKDEQGTASGVRFGAFSATLTVVEVTLSVAFLAAAGLAAQSLLVAGDIDSDLPVDEVLVAQVALADEVGTDAMGELIVPPGSIPVSQWATLQEEIRRVTENLPGVRTSLLITTLPGTQHGQSRIELENDASGDPTAGVRVPVSSVSPEFFETFDSALLAGRNFGRTETLESERVAIVNASFARRFFGDANPIGSRLRLDPSNSDAAWIRIVGVSADLRMNPGGDNRAGFYLPFAQDQRRTFTLAMRIDGDPLAMSAAVDDAIREIDPRIDVAGFETHAELAARGSIVFQIMSLMFTTIGGTAIFLAVAGLYAVMAFSVTQRTREIGIRLALGGDRLGVAAVVLRRGLLQVAIGTILGAGLGAALLRLLQYLPTGVASDGISTLAIASLAMLAAGVVASVVPASRALAVRPVEALRHE